MRIAKFYDRARFVAGTGQIGKVAFGALAVDHAVLRDDPAAFFIFGDIGPDIADEKAEVMQAVAMRADEGGIDIFGAARGDQLDLRFAAIAEDDVIAGVGKGLPLVIV